MRNVSASIFIIISVLIAIGVVMIYSASAIYGYEKMGDSLYFIKRHVIYVSIGYAVMFGLMLMDTNLLRRYSKHIVIFSAALLALVLVPGLGKSISGARRWFSLGPVTFQPSELAKIALIIYIADLAARKADNIRSFMHSYLPALVVMGGCVGLVLMEPDLGTAIDMAAIVLLMLFVSGVRVSYIALTFLASLPVLYMLLFSVSYRRKRLMIFLNPWEDRRGAGFQIIQSLIALGSGGIFGVGLGQSRQKLFYLPEAYTDFIFSIIGEELGLIGTLAIVLLFGLFVWQGMRVSLSAQDTFGRVLSFGVVSMIALEAIINIGVTSGVFPTKGLPLPLVSYGGTSLVFHMMAIGLVLNVAKRCEVTR